MHEIGLTQLQTQRSSAPVADPVHAIVRRRRPTLDVFFAPETVAVIGATSTAGSVGRTILWNLLSSPFGGTVFPVNPKRSNVLGIQAYPTIGAVPAPVDLAIVATPAPTVPGIIGECADAGVRGAIVISAGFKERGAAGAELERAVLANARRGNIPLIGPNCFGVMRPLSGLNATFANAIARPGNVGFISQSGALCTAILDWSLRENVGFSAFISIGSMLDVGWGALIDYLGDDPRTHSIVIYMESIGDARAFLSAAREVALSKPIIVLKAGRTAAAAQAAASHTGALTGSDAAEFALLIADQVQHKGLGSELLRQLLEVARQEQIGRVVADILPDNRAMQQICERLAFRLQHALAGPVKAKIEL